MRSSWTLYITAKLDYMSQQSGFGSGHDDEGGGDRPTEMLVFLSLKCEAGFSQVLCGEIQKIGSLKLITISKYIKFMLITRF